ncbi:helix-turn-helix transcriptional regulator [Salibacterium lacus]|uniref:Helix-turn-helix transcriptional regulator n=1 Tax=Salibacterium lacus TaxID=1898109 RepID=A0ABW5T0K9_9BACI
MNDITRTDDIVQELPETESFFNGIGATFGHVIFSYRMERGLTQKQLADISGVRLKTIHRAEGGTFDIDARTYEKIFRALDVRKEDVERLY